MGRCAAIGIDDDLAPGEARIAVRPADHEAAGGIHMEVFLRAHPAFGQDLLDIGPDEFLHLALVEAGAVLGGHHDRGRAHRPPVLVKQRDLALVVGSEAVAELAPVPGLRHPAQDFVAVLDGGGHQLRGLAAGIAEHQALVAGAFVLVRARPRRSVHAHGDVAGLLVHHAEHGAVAPVEGGLFVADLAHGLARELAHPLAGDGGGTPDFAADHDQVGRHHRFDAAAVELRLALRHEGVHDRVRNPVANLVRMAFGHRLAGEVIIAFEHAADAP